MSASRSSPSSAIFPKAWWIAAVIVGLFGLVPGMPHLPFLFFAGLLGGPPRWWTRTRAGAGSAGSGAPAPEAAPETDRDRYRRRRAGRAAGGPGRLSAGRPRQQGSARRRAAAPAARGAPAGVARIRLSRAGRPCPRQPRSALDRLSHSRLRGRARRRRGASRPAAGDVDRQDAGRGPGPFDPRPGVRPAGALDHAGRGRAGARRRLYRVRRGGRHRHAFRARGPRQYRRRCSAAPSSMRCSPISAS